MNWEQQIENEMRLFNEYMKIYVQICVECIQFGGHTIHKQQMPTFEYFKETYDDDRYSLVIPNYKEGRIVYEENKIGAVSTHGMGSEDGIAYRHYNIWMGCKYFTGGNINGDYTIKTDDMNEALKRLTKSRAVFKSEFVEASSEGHAPVKSVYTDKDNFIIALFKKMKNKMPAWWNW